MLYRRFVLVASLIMALGVGMANLVSYTKERRDIVVDYPQLRTIQLNRCNTGLQCRATNSFLPKGA